MSLTTDRHDPRLTHGVDDKPTPQAETYLIKDPAKAKFIRPIRTTYRHLTCGTVTTMATQLAESYAIQPDFYGATYCVTCQMHRPVGPNGEFIWDDDGTKVGT